ncbi:hypothetical protein HMPREF9371_0472 [Neisseria shayeganii 871]|uniref:Uncharacterized protein n=1 Tax=Neisseria shayeganii 871 TaxID=1032488 RepID=G4CFT3_9NEIS|nr:hypothetical protein HMPREF9371_0472 [Neisseria shayeganii 871]
MAQAGTGIFKFKGAHSNALPRQGFQVALAPFCDDTPCLNR